MVDLTEKNYGATADLGKYNKKLHCAIIRSYCNDLPPRLSELINPYLISSINRNRCPQQPLQLCGEGQCSKVLDFIIKLANEVEIPTVPLSLTWRQHGV